METNATATVPACAVPVPLLRIKCSYPVMVCATGPAVSIWMHWLPEFRRSMPCVVGRCPHCREGMPRRPLSYVPALVLRSAQGEVRWRRTVLELPLRTGTLLHDRQGQCFALRRSKPCGPIDAVPSGKLPSPKSGERIEVYATLFPLWRIPRTTAIALVSSGYTEE